MQQAFIKSNSRRLRISLGIIHECEAAAPPDRAATTIGSESASPANPTSIARSVETSSERRDQPPPSAPVLTTKKRPIGRPPKNHVWNGYDYVATRKGRTKSKFGAGAKIETWTKAVPMPSSYVTKVRQMIEASLVRGPIDVHAVTDAMVNRFVVNRFKQLGAYRGTDYRAALHWCQRHW